MSAVQTKLSKLVQQLSLRLDFAWTVMKPLKKRGVHINANGGRHDGNAEASDACDRTGKMIPLFYLAPLNLH